MTSKKLLVLVGAGAMCCTIWLRWNDIVYDNIPTSSFMQVLILGYTLDQDMVTVLKGGVQLVA
jgi:hypothetical protein